jgi:hypothetical protein
MDELGYNSPPAENQHEIKVLCGQWKAAENAAQARKEVDDKRETLHNLSSLLQRTKRFAPNSK